MLNIKIAFWIFITASSLLLASCATRKRCYQKYGEPGPTVYIHDTVRLTIPGATGSTNLDSDQVADLAPGDSLMVETSDGKTKAVLVRDIANPDTLHKKKKPLGYKLKAERKPETIVQTRTMPCPGQQIIRPPPEIIKETPWWVIPVISALITLLIVQTLRKILAGSGW